MTAAARINDATLREGMQTRSGGFSITQSLEIADLLVRTGVDMVECGHSLVSVEEEERIRQVVALCRNVPVLTHARMRREDVTAAAQTGAAWVGVFVGVNAISRSTRFDYEHEKNLLAKVRTTVRHAVSLGLKLRFTVEDASRTDESHMMRVLYEAADAGASRLCFADTVGYLEPHSVTALFERVKRELGGLETEGHFHDDRGLAMANALSAVDAGCTYISTSVNSLGERTGITDLSTFLLNQNLRADAPLPEAGLLSELSTRVGTFTRSHPDARRPVVGRDAFHHAARLHVLAVEKDPASYELIEPERIGRQRSLGSGGVSPSLNDLIVTPPVISATELRHHRHGPGNRYVLVDDRFVPGAGQYCIARHLPPGVHDQVGHVDSHMHNCDSLFGFLGEEEGYVGLIVEVTVGEETRILHSPASVFIPAGIPHTYRAISGAGTFLNHVLSGSYEESLLDPYEFLEQPSRPKTAIDPEFEKTKLQNESRLDARGATT